MGTEALKSMKQQLMGCVQGQLGDISKVDAHELGEAVDMIKDLSEAIYYCTITDSMEKAEDNKRQETNINYYTMPSYKTYPDYYRDMPKYMYMQDGNNMNGGASMSYYTEFPRDMQRDPREGRSPMRRRLYMEGKENHNDVNSQLKQLEAYLQELSSDITEMVKDASPEERATLRQKMTTLANKIN